MSLTKVSFSMVEGAYANVLDYGAVGDGVTDDTSAIQAAVNASDCVYFPPGKTYMVSSISIRAGMSLVGYSATLKLLPDQTKFVRILTTQNNLLNQVVDSEPLNVVGLTLDGNRVNQGPYLGYEKEQQQLLFLYGGVTNAGRLVVNVSDCNFIESCSDGIGVYSGVDVSISNCHFWNLYRGSITPIGGYSKTKFTNVSAGGDVHPSFLNIEIDGGGFGGDSTADICGSNSVFDGTLDCGMIYGGTVRLDNILFKGLGLDVVGSNVSNLLDFRATNCEFTVQNASDSFFQYPNFIQFSNCRFNHSESSSLGKYISVVWGTNTNQRIVFNNCQHVHIGAGAFTSDAVLSLSASTVASNNVVEFDGGSIGDGSAVGDLFTYGVQMSNGGSLKIDNTIVNSDYIALASASSGYNYSIHLGQVTLGANNAKLFFISSAVSGNVLRFDNTVIPSGKNLIDTSSGWGSGFTVTGGRIVFGASAPTSTDVAFIGDHYRLTTPVAGSAYEYVATNSSYTAAVWKTSATLAA